MWNFQRIICIWICCVSCMFGTTQLSSLVQAVPYEYFDDHEQSFYDLDTEQIQAKYDTRLLSQQMLQTEQQQQQQHLENLKGYHNTNSGNEGLANRNKLETRKHIDAGVSKTTKLKSNEGYNTLNVVADDFIQNDDERNDWPKETATKAAAEDETTSAITETFDELHLPRAASCFTNGQKYTHGQKVPRLDNCEVCLCMDGEIFCWWEKCDKKSTKASTTYEDYSTPFEESSTTRIQLNPKTTYKTTLKPMKKPKTNEDYKYDDDDSAEIFEMQQEYEGLKEQLMRKEHEQDELQEQQQQQQQQHKLHNHNKQMVKKKIYQQQEEEKHNKKIKEQNKKKQEEQQQHHKQQQQQKQHIKNNEQQKQQQHHHAHNRNKNTNNNNNHDYSSSSGSNSKILNFPENLPSVLYYDYKTEEHHQHQHQHREQHLKHQRQKQQQQLHEKELKHRQQQQQEQQKQQHHINRHHEYGQDFNTYSSSSSGSGINNAAFNKKLTIAGDERKLHDGFGGPSTTFKYFSNGNENIYNGDLQTDSDILPEPPTKKPKYSTSITETTATQAKTTGIPISQLYHFSTSVIPAGVGGVEGTSTTVEAITKSTATTTNTPSSMPTISLKKQNFSPWDYNNNVNRDKINNNSNNNKNNNKESTEDDIIDTDDQDDAFHRWLTSTEKNNKNNFTLNDSIIERDDVDDGLGLATATVAGGIGSGVFDASNIDYNMDDRNYENFNLAKETTKTNANIKSIVDMGAITGTTTINAFDNTLREGIQGIYTDVNSKIMYENSEKPKYEQNFNDNNSYNTNNNYNNPYQNNNMEQPTSRSSSSSSGHIISSTSSNEDNGVASVVNIDIMLTASSADTQQQQQQLPQQTNIIETTKQQRQQQQEQLVQHQQDFKHEKQIAKEQMKFIQPPPVLISNTNDVDNKNNNKNPLYSIINDNTKSYTITNNNNNTKTVNHIVGDGLNIELQNMGVNLSSSSNSNNNNTNSQNLSNSNNDNFRFNHISTLVSQTTATSATTIAGASAATTPPLSTTLSPERQCNVMGTLYKIGDVLPQDTGNCLQCICIDGSTSDDTPRVTCSPHNCPPLVLPDLFDATGY